MPHISSYVLMIARRSGPDRGGAAPSNKRDLLSVTDTNGLPWRRIPGDALRSLVRREMFTIG
jgi:hypothetical protein